MLDYFEEGDQIVSILGMDPFVGVMTEVEVEGVVTRDVLKGVAVVEISEGID